MGKIIDVHIHLTPHRFYATWQQSQDDQSQPLVMKYLSRKDAEKILA